MLRGSVLRRLCVGLALPLLLSFLIYSADPVLQLWHTAYALYIAPLLLLALLLGLGLSVVLTQRSQVLSYLKSHSLGIVVAATLTMSCFVLLPPSMRIQWDETVLLSSSQTLHFFRAYLSAQEAIPKQDHVQVLSWVIDKRPPLYPVLVSLLHDLRGAMEANAFAVNGFVLFLFLILANHWARKRFGSFSGLTAQFLLLSSPTVLLSATSGGYDLLAGLLFFVTLLSALQFVEKPKTMRLSFFLVLGCLYCYVRQESSLIFSLMLALSLFEVKRSGQWKDAFWDYLALLPGAITPLIFFFQHSRNPDLYENGAMPVVALGYFFGHLNSFFRVFFFSGSTPTLTGVLNFFGILVLGISAVRSAYRDGVGRGYIAFICLLVAFLIPVFWFYSDALAVGSWRLYLITLVLLAWAPLAVLDLFNSPKLKLGLLLVSVGVFLFQIQMQAQGGNIEKGPHDLAREGLEKLIVKIQAEAPHSLFVSNVPCYFLTKGFGGLAPATFIERYDALLKEKQAGNTQHIFILRIPNHEDEAQVSAIFEDLNKKFNTTLYGRFRGEYPMEIREVTGLK